MAIKRKTNSFFARADRIDQSRRTVAKSDLAFLGAGRRPLSRTFGDPLSLRNVEDLLFERGIDICHETVRLWWNRFGPMFAAEVRRGAPRSC
jgi:hypothetical protein